MKKNIITLKDNKGVKKEYRILFNIEDALSKKNYVVYTLDKENKGSNIKAYASTYEISDKGNMVKLEPIDEKDEFDFIDKVLNSLQSIER